MMKLLIAEDEFLCRRNLTEINWNAIGCEIIAVAENGEQAMELAKKHKPDIIITDIKMPRMSGLELANELSAIMPKIKFIILTAHNNFEYVRKSISLGIYEYILKPFKDEKLIEAAKGAIKKIEAEQSSEICIEELSKQLENCRFFLKDYFFASCSGKSGTTGTILNLFGDVKYNSKYIVMAVSVEADGEPALDFPGKYNIFTDLNRVLSNLGYAATAFFDISCLTFLFPFSTDTDESYAQSKINEISETIVRYLDFANNIKYIIGIGKCISGLENILISYNGALDALNYSFYLGFNTALNISDMEPNRSTAHYFSYYDENLFNHIKVGDTASALMIIKRLFDAFRENKEKISIVQRICNEILVRTSNCLIQCDINPNVLFDKTDIFALIKKHTTISALEKFISNIIEVTISQIKFSRTTKNKTLVENIKLYISQNLSTSLVEIANHFYISPNYLSNIFSLEAGTTVKSYIIQKRISTAKHLLTNTNTAIYDIATSVGYKNVPHFNLIFKQYTGTTPMAYRKSKMPEE